MKCPNCGTETAAGARFCSACGHSLQTHSDERRVVTVVFADLVGFTSLAEGRDPEEVKNLVDDCMERLAADIVSFGGQVDKVIGDAIVALFGAPVAHEDDPERAVRAALAMLRAARPGQPPLRDAEARLVMHVSLPILGGHVLMGTDSPESMGGKLNQGNNVYINLEPDTRAETDQLFAALSAGGKEEMALQEMFWGAYWGSLADRFGVQWMFNCAAK